MEKKIVSFNRKDNKNAVLELSATCLSPEQHKDIMIELRSIRNLQFNYIDADSITAVVTGYYSEVFSSLIKCKESGFSFN
jgi:hypothetical protein